MTALVRARLPAPDITSLLRSPLVHAAVGVAVAVAVTNPSSLALVIVGVAALGCLAVAARFPLGSVVMVVVLLPFVQLLQSWLWTHDVVPVASAVRLGYLKDLVVAVAFARAWVVRPRPLGRLDRLALATLGLVAFFIVLPFGPSIGIRYVAGRSDAGFIVVFLTARWLPTNEKLRRTAEVAVIVSAAVIAALGVWNRLRPESWSRWVDSTGILEFRRTVLNAPTLGAVERVQFGAGTVIRAGSLFFTPNDLGYFMLVMIALIAGRMAIGLSRRWEPVVASLCALCLFFTFSRSAMALVAVVGLIVAVASGRLNRGMGAMVLTVVVIVVLVAGLGAGDEIASGVNVNDQRTSGHLTALSDAAQRIAGQPLGTGLGTSSATAIRFDVANSVQTEDFYLRFGVEVGVLGLVLMVAFVLMTLRLLWHRARLSGGPAIGAMAALSSVAIGALVLETFSELATAWTLWLFVGLALSAVDSAPLGPRAPTRSTRVAA